MRSKSFKIIALTSSRADFGIMSELLKELQASPNYSLVLVVTGTHLSLEHGQTIDEIINYGLFVSYKLEFPLGCDEPSFLTKSTALLMEQFAEVLSYERPDLLLVLGDRYELLAPVSAAVMQGIEIAHIHGGETTLGAIDNKVRNAVTQMADIHFVATALAAKRVRALCPQDRHIYHVGSLSVDMLASIKLFDREALGQKFKWNVDNKIALVTFHPQTIGDLDAKEQVSHLLRALDSFPETFKVITCSNADPGGRVVSHAVREYARNRTNIDVQQSLGHRAYISCLANFDIVIGNSSSAIIEAPQFGIPCVNIGERQQGRETSDNILNVVCHHDHIVDAINVAINNGKMPKKSSVKSPYGKLGARQNIMKVLDQLSNPRGEFC